jgi:hypothetical protein
LKLQHKQVEPRKPNNMIPNLVGCGRRLYRTIHPLIEQSAHTEGADRYRKHFLAVSHIWLLILHLAHGGHSLRQSHAQLGADPGLRRRLQMSKWVSFSQLARSSSRRQASWFEELLEELTKRVKRTPSSDKDQDWQYLHKAKAIDSTFVRLSAQMSPWSKQGGYEAGVRVQCGLELGAHIPELVHMHGVDKNDHVALWEQDLTPFVGWTLVVDLGYYGHRQFRRLLDSGVHVLSKLHKQASYRVTEDRVVAQKKGWVLTDDLVVSDQTITLGSPNNRRGAVLSGLRLVTSRTPDGEECQLITDRFDLQAWEVGELYRKRWQIELFFRWLKRQLGAARSLGQSREAVWLTMVVGCIVALVWLLLEQMGARPKAMSRISWLRAAAVGLQQALNLSG